MTNTPTPTTPSAASEPTTMRISPALLVVICIPLVGLAAAVGMLLGEQSARTGQDGTGISARVGSLDQPLPDFTPVTLTGDPVDLEQYRGRPIFINFWGTWCPPCVEELPELQAFAAAQGDDGAVVLAVNYTEQPETIAAFFAENNFDLPDIQFVLDADSAMYRWFGVYQAPSTYLVDRNGVVRSVKYGPFTITGMQSYLDALESAENSG